MTSRCQRGLPLRQHDLCTLKQAAVPDSPSNMEARPGIEPGCEDLQSSTSPLRHRAPMRTAQMLGFAGAVNRDMRPMMKYPDPHAQRSCSARAAVVLCTCSGCARHGQGRYVCDGSKPACVAFSETMPALAAIGCHRGSAVVFRMRPRRPARDIFGVTRAGGASTLQNWLHPRTGYIPESAHLGGLACISRLAHSSARDTYRRDN